MGVLLAAGLCLAVAPSAAYAAVDGGDITGSGLSIVKLPEEETVYKAGNGTVTVAPSEGGVAIALDNATLKSTGVGTRSKDNMKINDGIRVDIYDINVSVTVTGANSFEGFEGGINSYSPISLKSDGSGSLRISGEEHGIRAPEVVVDGLTIDATSVGGSILYGDTVVEVHNSTVTGSIMGEYGDCGAINVYSRWSTESRIVVDNSTLDFKLGDCGVGIDCWNTNGTLSISNSTITFDNVDPSIPYLGGINIAGKGNSVKIADSSITNAGVGGKGILSAGDLVISGASSIEANANALEYYTNDGYDNIGEAITVSGTLTISDSSSVKAVANGGYASALTLGAAPVVTGTAKLEAIAEAGATTNATVDVSGYAAPICSVLVNGEATAEGAAEWDRATDLTTYKYLRIEPGRREDIEGGITVDVTVDPSAPKTIVANTKAEMISAVADEDELDAVAQGYDLDIWLEVKDASETVSDESKALVAAVAKDQVVGAWLDIALFKQMSNEEAATAVHETKAPVTVVVSVPADLLKVPANTTRTYSIVRVHDGVAEVLPTTFDKEAGTLTFQTDRFSDYAIVYKDVAVQSPVNAAKSGKGALPQTGEDGLNGATLAVLGLGVALAVAGVATKKVGQR